MSDTTQSPAVSAGESEAIEQTMSAIRSLIREMRMNTRAIESKAGMSLAQRDSTIRVNDEAIRSTNISLDYAVDQAMVMNRGGNRPWMAVMGTVREVESLDRLGPPKSHVERARRLCGV